MEPDGTEARESCAANRREHLKCKGCIFSQIARQRTSSAAGREQARDARSSNKFSGAGAERDGRNRKKVAPLRQHRWEFRSEGS